MTEEELRKLFPHASDELIKRWTRLPSDTWGRPGVQFQESKKDRGEQADHGSAHKAADEDDHGRFAVAIAFGFANRQRRDLDGCAATILDCLIAARRRLLDENS